MPFFAELQARGLIQQFSDGALPDLLERERVTAYCGFDPTSASLHIGSLMPILGLARLQRAGHRPIAVVGGATGMIGDPSGKSEERRLLSPGDIAANCAGIRKQLERFLDFSGESGARLVDNHDWFADVRLLDFLRDTGKHFTVNYMLAKESVRARLEDREHGISFTEFSYMLIQAYDFLHLHEAMGCRLQIGGNDQWGNITAGIELIRRKRGAQAFGYTLPLITTADGKKFGKTEAGTSVWLDAERTSPYQMFQYFLNVDDRDAARFLGYFTFLPLDRIAEIARESAKAPERREAQRVLAREVTALVHGAEAARRAEEGAAALFAREADPAALVDQPGIPRTSHARAALDGGVAILELLRATGLAKSMGEGRRDIAGGGVYLNEERVADPNRTVSAADLRKGAFVVLRKGKKNYHVVKFE